MKITKITKEQAAQFGEWSKKWIEIGLSTAPADFDAATDAALRAYAACNLAKPMVILRMQSPYAATIGGAMAWAMLKELGEPKVESQEEADRRIPHLLAVPARVRFLSCEPLLGPVDLADITDRSTSAPSIGEHCYSALPDPDDDEGEPYINWVICGGESGPGARPMNPQWARDLRDQCAVAIVPYFHKQNGEFVSVSEMDGPGAIHEFADGRCVRRVGTKRAGDLLDGVQHHEFPA